MKVSQTHPLPFVLAASDLGPMIVSRLDYAQSAQGGFYGVGFQILHTGSYDATEVEDVKAILRSLRTLRGDGVVALDCGANIGVHSLAMAKEMIGWGEVLAFEAQERLFYALCGNIALGNFFNVRALWTAVSDRPGTIEIPKVDYLRHGSYGSLELRHSAKTEYIGQSVSYATKDMTVVACTSIDHFAFPRVDFIKLDVEGMELEVLAGARETIIKYKPILLIEWIKVGQPAIRDFLVPLGYQIAEAGMNLIASHENHLNLKGT